MCAKVSVRDAQALGRAGIVPLSSSLVFGSTNEGVRILNLQRALAEMPGLGVRAWRPMQARQVVPLLTVPAASLHRRGDAARSLAGESG